MYVSIDDLSPVDPMACRMCVAEVAGVFVYSVHSWTLCSYHWFDWAEEKMASDGY